MKDTIAEIKESWRARAEPRVKQHDVDELVWTARHRSHEWYHKNCIICGTGIPIYNKVEIPEFEVWTIRSCAGVLTSGNLGGRGD